MNKFDKNKIKEKLIIQLFKGNLSIKDFYIELVLLKSINLNFLKNNILELIDSENKFNIFKKLEIYLYKNNILYEKILNYDIYSDIIEFKIKNKKKKAISGSFKIAMSKSSLKNKFSFYK